MSKEKICDVLKKGLKMDDNWTHLSLPVDELIKKAREVLKSAQELPEEAVRILISAFDVPLDEKEISPKLAAFFDELLARFPDNAPLAFEVACIYYQQGRADDCAKLIIETLEKDPRTHLIGPDIAEFLKSHPDQKVRSKYWAAYLKDIEKGEGTKAVRRFFNDKLAWMPHDTGQKKILSKEDSLELWGHLMKTGNGKFIKLTHQPDYIVVYDEMWGRVIESYFVRKKNIPEEEEPDDTMNGPIEEEKVQDFFKFLRETRYPEKERFKFGMASADSFTSIMHDLGWILGKFDD